MAEEMLDFNAMDEEELQQWVETNPERVNDRDTAYGGYTPLYVALWRVKSLPLTVWLVDEKGADVNGTTRGGDSPLHVARSLDILLALLDRGASSTLFDRCGQTHLMSRVTVHREYQERIDIVARLLQHQRVRATVNVPDREGRTALHHACLSDKEASTTTIIRLLLQAAGNPKLADKRGKTPLAFIRRRNAIHHTTIALLEQAPDAEKTSLLVKGRLAIAATAATASNTVVPSCLQGRVAGGQPLPRVALMHLTGRQKGAEKRRKSCKLVAFVLGMEGGPENTGMPRDVFRGVFMDLLMPTWDPLRRKWAGTGPPTVQG